MVVSCISAWAPVADLEGQPHSLWATRAKEQVQNRIRFIQHVVSMTTERPCLAELRYLPPLLLSGIHASGIVSTRVEQEDRARGCVLKSLKGERVGIDMFHVEENLRIHKFTRSTTHSLEEHWKLQLGAGWQCQKE